MQPEIKYCCRLSVTLGKLLTLFESVITISKWQNEGNGCLSHWTNFQSACSTWHTVLGATEASADPEAMVPRSHGPTSVRLSRSYDLVEVPQIGQKNIRVWVQETAKGWRFKKRWMLQTRGQFQEDWSVPEIELWFPRSLRSKGCGKPRHSRTRENKGVWGGERGRHVKGVVFLHRTKCWEILPKISITSVHQIAQITDCWGKWASERLDSTFKIRQLMWWESDLRSDQLFLLDIFLLSPGKLKMWDHRFDSFHWGHSGHPQAWAEWGEVPHNVLTTKPGQHGGACLSTSFAVVLHHGLPEGGSLVSYGLGHPADSVLTGSVSWKNKSTQAPEKHAWDEDREQRQTQTAHGLETGCPGLCNGRWLVWPWSDRPWI